METLLLQAPKLYLDTNHLINIAKLRKGDRSVSGNRKEAYSLIDDCIRRRHFGLILNPLAAMEWVDGNATLESANEIADVIDSAALQYELEADTAVYLHEVLKELKRLDSRLSLPEYEILHVRSSGGAARRPWTVLEDRVPGYFDDGELVHKADFESQEVAFGTAREAVQWAWEFKHDRGQAFQERVNGYKAAFGQDLDALGMRKSKPIQKHEIIQWMKRFLKVDRVLNGLNTGVDVDGLLGKIEVERCPAVKLFLSAREKRIRAANLPDENEVDDWLFLPVVPYADLVLTERNLRSFIEQADPTLAAKATHDPNRAVEILRKWIE